jgi:NTE family protein
MYLIYLFLHNLLVIALNIIAGIPNTTRRMSRLPQILLLFLSIQLPLLVSSQDTLQVRPRLGLALSGGGSKGIAHIGVLKVMEEAGLRPDYISGVSMGSIVGGLYATGFSSDSLARLFLDTDWDLLLSDRIPENKIIFNEKKHFYNSIISVPVTREHIVIPSSLISGQQVENALNFYFWRAAEIYNFSHLPIPFLCVATDMLTGSEVVLKEGYLPDAIRASMSIPSVFSAVPTDTALLVDGGVVRNYAAGELRSVGCDIVIGSYVSLKRSDRKNLESGYEMLKQVGFMASLADYDAQKKLTDILIEPELKAFPPLSYNDVDTLIERGYRAALPLKERFRRLADSLNAIQPEQPVIPLPEIKYRIFDKVEVVGNEKIKTDQITGVLDIDPGQKVDRDMLSDKIELLYGKGWFEKVNYRIVPRNDSLILQINCIERPATMLYGSLHYDNTLGAGVLVSISARDLITTRSVINAESFIGQYFRYRLSMMQYIDHSQKFGVEASYFIDNTRLPLIKLGSETGPMVSQNNNISVSLGKRISLNHLMDITASYENMRLVTDYIPENKIDKLTYDYLRLVYRYQANTLNYKHFPDKGIVYCITASGSKLLRGTRRLDGEREVYLPGNAGDFSFERSYSARGWFRTYTSPSDKLTLDFGGEALYMTHADSVFSGNNAYYLGGVEPATERSVPAIGFHGNQIPVKGLAGIRVGADFEIVTDLHLCLSGNVFAIQELDREYGLSLLAGYGACIGYMTVSGPIKIGIMHGIYNREVFFKPVKGYVSIGFSF